ASVESCQIHARQLLRGSLTRRSSGASGYNRRTFIEVHMTFSPRSRRQLLLTLLFASLLCLPPGWAAAQAIYGTVTGQVTDTSGAAIPGATVVITNESTGLMLDAVTDETGTYTVRNVTAGPYTLRATLQGFKEYVQTGIPVTPGGIVRVNGRLEVGALSETVTVTTEAALLKTDKADVSVDLRPEDVVNMPLNQYRNYQA